jgi:hypothetical protein
MVIESDIIYCDFNLGLVTRQGKQARGGVVTSFDSHLNVWKVQGKKIDISKCILIFRVQSWLEVVEVFWIFGWKFEKAKFVQIKLF